MTLSIIAIVIALFSLLWNVISSVYSWKNAKPLVKVESNWAQMNVDGKLINWLIVGVRNIGGAAISVTSIDISRQLVNKPGGPLRRGFGLTANSSPDKSYTGPVLPYTIVPNHSEEWKFDLGAYDYLLSLPRPDELLMEVRLGTGQVITHKTRTETLPIVHGLNFVNGEEN